MAATTAAAMTALPLCRDCENSGVERFSLNCSRCTALCRDRSTSVEQLFSVMRQWTPEAQRNLTVFCEEMLRRSTPVGTRDALWDMTMLHYASKAGAPRIGDDEKAAALVTMLLDRGADINDRCTVSDMTPLHIAAYYGCPGVLASLLAHKRTPLDFNAKCRVYDDSTALHLAVISGHVKCVEVLANAGVSRSIEDRFSHRPIDLARRIEADANSLIPKPDIKEIIRILSECTVEERTVPLITVKKVLPQQRHLPAPEPVTPVRRKVPAIPETSPSTMRALTQAALRTPSKRDEDTASQSSKASLMDMVEDELDDIHVGDRVKVLGGDRGEGTVRFKGETQFKAGRWYGVQLDKPSGINNGTVGTVRYFSAKQKHGVFVRRRQLELVSKPSPLGASPRHSPAPFTAPTMNPNTIRPDKGMSEDRRNYSFAKAQSPAASPRNSRRNSPLASPAVTRRVNPDHAAAPEKKAALAFSPFGPLSEAFGIHSRVMYKHMDAVVQFIGPTHVGEGLWLGLELTEAKGKHDGQVGDQRYFQCRPNHGVLVKPSLVTWHGHNCGKVLSNQDFNLSDSSRKK
eukprot:m.36061 g.36061  ORF g.36061 m.36061 type:complete len:573 (-) comp5758_c0_seq2:88-1806(-)